MSEVLVYLCECGPLMAEGLDLEELENLLGQRPDVKAVKRYTTLCSDEGQTWFESELQANPGARMVLAGCSPREHETTFREVCRRAGANPYLVAFANIREQCSWVHTDRAEATKKAQIIVHAAIERCKRLEPLEEEEISCHTDALVIGSGVAGLTAALMLAQAGRKVYLVERSPAIGGMTALLGDVYPNLECASCMLDPLMDEVLHHAQIEVMTYAEVEEILGSFGNFTVRIRKRARRVAPDACFGCSTCHEACPVEVPRDVDFGLSKRKAIYIPYTGSLPNASLIDEGTCLHTKGQECAACLEACPFGAIQLDAVDETVERTVGGVIVATGAEPQPDGREDPAAGILPAMALERILNSAGPTTGEVTLPGLQPPTTIALFHCLDASGGPGSEAGSDLCCAAVAKYVHQLSEKVPEATMYEFVWENCTSGRGAVKHAPDGTGLTVKHIRLAPGDRVAGVVGGGGRLLVRYILDGVETEGLPVDMVVYCRPLAPSPGSGVLRELLRLEAGPTGFLLPEHERLRPFRTSVEGVFIAGSAAGPKDIHEAAAEGAAAAACVLALLVPGRMLRVEPATAEVKEEACGGCHSCVLACPYKAVTFSQEKGVATVNRLLCRGCGSCAAACPSSAIYARHFSDDQIMAEVRALLQKGPLGDT